MSGALYAQALTDPLGAEQARAVSEQQRRQRAMQMGSVLGTMPSMQPPQPAAPTVSTRVPSGANAPPDVHTTPSYIATAGVSRETPEGAESLDKNLDALRQDSGTVTIKGKGGKPDTQKEVGLYPDIKTQGIATPDLEASFKARIKDNLRWLHNEMPDDIRERAKQWYVGANKIAGDLAGQFGISHQQAAGVLANLSPQMDWFQNVDLAKRLLKIHTDAPEQTPGMAEQFQRFVDGAASKNKSAMAAQVAAIGNRPYGELTDPYHQALWIRAHDEAEGALDPAQRSYKVITPEGGTDGNVQTPVGKVDRKVGWGGFNEIEKALRVLHEDSTENISRNLGENHKVRNFFNNISNPDDPNAVTIDTHAIAAAHLRPLGGSHPVVGRGLGTDGSGSVVSGMKGLYGVYADAYRELAHDLKIKPRELQSITWEGVRGMFSDVQKRNAGFVSKIDNIWREHKAGAIDAQTARNQVLDEASEGSGRIRAPEWVGLDPAGNARTQPAAGPGDLPRPGGARGGSRRRARGDAAAAAAAGP